MRRRQRNMSNRRKRQKDKDPNRWQSVPFNSDWSLRFSVGGGWGNMDPDGLRRALAGFTAAEWPLDIQGNTRARRSRKWRRAHRAFPPFGVDRFKLYQISEPSNVADDESA